MNYKMPLLDLSDHYLQPVDWSNILVIACQHILESNFLYLKKMVDQGLPRNNLYILGKSYSTSDAVMADAALGVYVHPSSNQFDSHQSFYAQFRAAIADLFNMLAEKVNYQSFNKVVIIDDGAELLLYANEHIDKLDNFAGVEQTSSGFHKLNAHSVKFPVKNVARSQAKLTLESPFIADAVLQNLQRHLQTHRLQPKKVLIVGSGAIGSCIYDKLQSDYHLQRFDLEKDKSDFSHVELDRMLPHFDMILSCVGTTVFVPEDYQYFKPGVILASASSSDVEFGGGGGRGTS